MIYSNVSAYAMLQWACANIGAVLVTLNPAYRSRELVSKLDLIYATAGSLRAIDAGKSRSKH